MAFVWMPCCVVGCCLRNSIDTADMPSSKSLFADHIETFNQHKHLQCSSDFTADSLHPARSTFAHIQPYPTESTNKQQQHPLALQEKFTWQMEDHLCPRIVQPQAACLLCLSRLSQEPVKQPIARCTTTTNRVRFTVATAKAPKTPSRHSRSQAAAQTPRTTAARTRTRSRVDHAVQPAAPRPTPATTTPPHNSLQNHMSHPDLAKFSANITTTAIPAEALEAAQAPLPHEPSPLYARLMKRYSASSASALLNPWAKPINSRRSLPTPR
jgi:hypothetical protein